MAATHITAERLWLILDYDDKTGLFTWRQNRSRTARKGEVAGAMIDGYIAIMIGGRSYRAHNLACLYMTGEWPVHEMDHENTIRDDNRWENLRDVRHQVNCENRTTANSNSMTGLLGVSPHPRSGRFRARIRVSGKLRALGWFDTPEAAHQAYLTAKRQMHEGCTI